MNSAAADLQSMLCIQPIRHQSTMGNIEHDAIQAMALSNITSFSSDIADFLRYVEEYGHKVAQDCVANIDRLQEFFLGAVHQAFQLAGVSLDARMIISLNRQGALHIESACAEQARIEELLSFSKALPALLKLLSVQNAILEGISNFRLMAEAQEKGESEKLSQIQQAYRVCLQGQLSHFYSI